MLSQEVLLVGLVCSMGLTAVVAALVWRERPKTGATAMAVVLVGLSLWAAGQIVVVGMGSLPFSLFGYAVTLAGTALVALPWLVFAIQYVGRGEWVTRRRIAVLALEPVAIMALTLTNSLHELVLRAPTVTAEAGQSTVSFGVGPALLTHLAVAYAASLVGDYYLLRKFLASRNVYRKRTFLFVFMSVSVVAASVLSVAGLSPLPHLTLVPIVFLGFGLVSLALVSGNWFISALPLERLFGLLRSRSKNLSPVARETAIEKLTTGFVVTDHANRIVDINPMARRMLGQAGNRIVGKELTEVLPPSVYVDDVPAFMEPGVTGEFSGVWVQTAAGEARCYDITVTELATDGDDATGRVGLMHDVTERERRKQQLEAQNVELERQNEQLEQFANIVSHDLRNPLNVANGRLELVDAGDDQPHVEEARGALDRIEDIIHDVLTLARLGKTIDDTDHVELGAVASDAWDNVDAPRATLVIDVDDTVDASRSRLLQVFENLYRNAIEHGRPDATITVGTLDDGFYVADDGSGIPDAHLDDVLDEGFTTEDDGTGFGLSIVETIAEAHGWSVAVDNALDTGGAQFEFTGLDTTRQHEQPSLAD